MSKYFKSDLISNFTELKPEPYYYFIVYYWKRQTESKWKIAEGVFNKTPVQWAAEHTDPTRRDDYGNSIFEDYHIIYACPISKEEYLKYKDTFY